MSLTCVLATRGRPALLEQTLRATLANVTLPDTRILVAADLDDPGTTNLLMTWPVDRRLVPSIVPREDDLGSKYNRALKDAPADVYLHMVDYAPVVTMGFDAKVTEAAALWPDNIGVVNSHLANLSFPAAQGITAGLAAQLGYIYPPYFPYWFVDHWLDDIAKLIGRTGFADIELDVGKRPGTQEMREPGWWASFFDVLAPYRSRQAARIIKSDAFAALPWQKEVLLRSAPLTEQRSRIINEIVRRQVAPQVGPGAAPNERYQRLKAQALGMLKEAIAEMEAEAATAAINKKAAA